MTARAASAAAESPTPPPAEARRQGASRNQRRVSAPVPVAEGPSLGRRILDVAKQLVAVGIVLGLVGAGTFGAYRLALTTPRFAVRDLEITGARRLTEAKLVQLGGIEMGKNVFATDMSEIRDRLLESPWIARAEVSRQLPSTVRIEIEERQVGAIATMGGHLYLVTRTGEPFKELRLEDGDPYDLPVVSGVSADELTRDRGRAIDRLRTAMDVVRHYERLPMSKVFPPQEAFIAEDGEVVVTVGEKGIALHLGRGPWRKKLLMASTVVSQVQRRGHVPGIVFADNEAHPERVVVRMR